MIIKPKSLLTTLIGVIISLSPLSQAYTLEFTATAEQNVTHNQQYQHINGQLTHMFFEDLQFLTKLSMYNDKKYSPAMDGDYYGDYYFYMEQGGFELEKENYGMRIGRLAPQPIIDSPYSLFISSEQHSTITGSFYLEDEHFFFQSQWLQLNYNSTISTDDESGLNEHGFSDGFPDRGANVRYYGLRFGDMRVGFEDASVYFDRSFDLEYLVNPLPAFFIQYTNISSGKPWQHNENENALIGFFFDYNRPDYYIYSELLLDDVNVHMFFDDSYTNPNKIAWSLGGTYDFSFGEVAFHHAGATKYLFEPRRNNQPYGYTYYPDTVYFLDDDTLMGISPEDNYIGYKYGENNLAFLLSYEPAFDLWAKMKGSLEFVLSGSKSPVNPFHQYSEYQQGGYYTKMFNDTPLEKSLSLSIDARKDFTENLSMYTSIELGYIWNKLKLTTVPQEYIDYYENEDPDYPKTDEDGLPYDLEYLRYYVPSSETTPITNLTIGVQYSYDPFK